MAKYFVTTAPGMKIDGVGFCFPGDSFNAPIGFVPSITLLPLDEDAKSHLVVTIDQRIALITERKANASGADRTRWSDELVRLAGVRAKAEVVLTAEEAAVLRDHTPGAKDSYHGGRLIDGNP